MPTERLVAAAESSPAEEQHNLALRPTKLAEYIGQPKLVEKLTITLQAVRDRGEPMEHTLLHGPPGLGKTTLAHIIAHEMGTHLSVSAGPALTKPGDLVGLLTKLQPRDVLFIDEIHRLPIALEEYLYSAMEDFKIDVQIEQGMHARTVTLPVQPFTLIGATTRAGLLSAPMRSRFGLQHNLEFYPPDHLLQILHRSASLLQLKDGKDASAALELLAHRARGTPRIANRLLRRVRDYAQVKHHNQLNPAIVTEALKLEGIDELGLDELDHKYLRTLATVYQGGPVGLEAIAATLGEDAGTLEQAVEPFLLQSQFLARTRRGRALTPAAAEHLGVTLPEPDPTLFPQPDTPQN
ncbi:MAG: Holliday junction branch migration DNA helicase RuvB [Planctomycetota bacterium]